MPAPTALVILVGLAVDRATTPFARHGRSIDHHTFNLVCDGHGLFAGDDGIEQPVHQGDAIYLHADRWHRFAPAAGTRWTEYWVAYDRQAVEERLGAELILPPGPHPADPDSRRWFEDLHGLWLTRPPGWQVRADLALHTLLVGAWRSTRGDRSPARDDLVGRACGWLEEGLDEPGRSLDLFAHRAGISPERLRKRFRAALGVPPGEWLLQLRLRNAQNLLLSTSLAVGAVAQQVGMPDPFHFSRMFRRHLGCSPRTYRQRGG